MLYLPAIGDENKKGDSNVRCAFFNANAYSNNEIEWMMPLTDSIDINGSPGGLNMRLIHPFCCGPFTHLNTPPI